MLKVEDASDTVSSRYITVITQQLAESRDHPASQIKHRERRKWSATLESADHLRFKTLNERLPQLNDLSDLSQREILIFGDEWEYKISFA